MTQSPIAIPTTGPLPGLTLITDINGALATLATQCSGPAAPTAAGLSLTSLAGVTWYDTTTGTIWQRNQADSAWMPKFYVNETSGACWPADFDGWVATDPHSYASATSTTVPGNQTGRYTVGRRLRAVGAATGTIYGKVTAAAYASPNTTVTVTWDSGALTNEALTVSTGPGISGKTLDASAIAGTSALVGFRNRLINGDMRVDQVNAGAAQTIIAGAALVYTVDQWYAYCTGANVTGQRVAGSSQTEYRYQLSGTAGVSAIGFGQRIETLNTFDLNNATATLSVDLANSLLTTVTWTAYYANTTDTFGTLASPTRTQIATGTFTVNSTVARYSAQIAIPAAAATGVEVVFSVGAQVGGTWTVGNVQLEPGATATAFERRPITTELALCQRYFQWVPFYFSFYSTAGAVAHTIPAPFPVQMRVTPTCAGISADPNTGQAAANNTSNTVGGVSPTYAALSLACGGVGLAYVWGYRSAANARM
jgi:hypothetical protein